MRSVAYPSPHLAPRIPVPRGATTLPPIPVQKFISAYQGRG
jgi:hypothetical protein